MSKQIPGFQLLCDNHGESSLVLSGDWVQGHGSGDFDALQS
jgi:hypothetical protein